MICKQGNVDGLCGFYALVNFIVQKKLLPGDPYEQGREAFRYLAESAEHLGMLTAHRIHDGFEWPLLKEIFNHWAALYGKKVRAFSLQEVADLEKKPTNRSVISRTVDSGGGAMLSVKNGRHWVFVLTPCSDEGRFDVIDSDWDEPEDPRKQFDDVRCGIALISMNTELMRELDAQTR